MRLLEQESANHFLSEATKLKQPIAHLCHYRGTYSIFDQRHRIDPKTHLPALITPFPGGGSALVDCEGRVPLEAEEDMNKLWVVVRHLSIDGKANEYKLSSGGGEIVKVGRVKFRVREISVAEDDNKTDFNSIDENLDNPL